MDRIQLRRDTSARWAEINPILLEGEVGYEIDTKLRKIGDGVNRWNDLEYLRAEGISQETGDSQNITMSQEAITRELSELGSEVDGNYLEVSTSDILHIPYTIKRGETYIIDIMEGAVGVGAFLYLRKDTTPSGQLGVISLAYVTKKEFTFEDDFNYLYIAFTTTGSPVRFSIKNPGSLKDSIEKNSTAIERIDKSITELDESIQNNKKSIDKVNDSIQSNKKSIDIVNETLYGNAGYAEQTIELSSGSDLGLLPYTIPSGTLIKSIKVIASDGSIYNALTGRTNETDSNFINLSAGNKTTIDVNYIKCYELNGPGEATIICEAKKEVGITDLLDNLSNEINGGKIVKTIDRNSISAPSYMGLITDRIAVRVSGTPTYTIGNYPIKSNRKYRVSIPNTASEYGIVWAVTKNEILYSDETYTIFDFYLYDETVGGKGEYAFEFLNEHEGYNLAISYNSKNGEPIVEEIYETQDLGDISNTESIGRKDSAVKKQFISNGIRAEKDVIEAGGHIVLEDYPIANKMYGESYLFTAKFDSFELVKIGKGNWRSEDGGFEDYMNCWIEIDNSLLKIYEITNTSGGDSNKTLLEEVNHSLVLSDFIYVNLCQVGANVRISVVTNSNESENSIFVHETDKFNKDATGKIHAVSNSQMNNAVLSANNEYFKSAIWVFGASFESVSTSSYWQYHVRKIGSKGYLSNGYPGRESIACFTELVKALQIGSPRLLYWTMWGNGSAEALDGKLSLVYDICRTKNIDLVIIDRPNSIASDVQESYNDRKAVIEKYKDMGVRCVDAAQALSVNPSSPNGWYDGFLSSDGKHTTSLGAQALGMRVLVDIPEFMQLSK